VPSAFDQSSEVEMVADDKRGVKDKACEMAAISITSTADPDY
jgi:hypothetical protein